MPVDVQMLGKERGDVLASAVGCTTCLDELVERSVDESHACGAVSEALDDGADLSRGLLAGTREAGPAGFVVGFKAT
jgi:hypothetical protein